MHPTEGLSTHRCRVPDRTSELRLLVEQVRELLARKNEKQAIGSGAHSSSARHIIHERKFAEELALFQHGGRNLSVWCEDFDRSADDHVKLLARAAFLQECRVRALLDKRSVVSDSISASVAPVRPKRMFSRMLVSNRKDSWKTMACCARSECWETARKSCPSRGARCSPARE